MKGDPTDFSTGDLVILRAGQARVVSNVTFDGISKLIQSCGFRQTIDTLLGMTMVWNTVASDLAGIVVSKLADGQTGFEMYFILVSGTIVALYGFYDGISVAGRVDDAT